MYQLNLQYPKLLKTVWEDDPKGPSVVFQVSDTKLMVLADGYMEYVDVLPPESIRDKFPHLFK